MPNLPKDLHPGDRVKANRTTSKTIKGLVYLVIVQESIYPRHSATVCIRRQSDPTSITGVHRSLLIKQRPSKRLNK